MIYTNLFEVSIRTQTIAVRIRVIIMITERFTITKCVKSKAKNIDHCMITIICEIYYPGLSPRAQNNIERY